MFVLVPVNTHSALLHACQGQGEEGQGLTTPFSHTPRSPPHPCAACLGRSLPADNNCWLQGGMLASAAQLSSWLSPKLHQEQPLERDHYQSQPGQGSFAAEKEVSCAMGWEKPTPVKLRSKYSCGSAGCTSHRDPTGRSPSESDPCTTVWKAAEKHNTFTPCYTSGEPLHLQACCI